MSQVCNSCLHEGSKTMKLNLGCGKDYRVGWINIDINPNHKADYHGDIRMGFALPPESVSYVLMNHVFEHLTFREGESVLRNMHEILEGDGTLEIAVPDLTQAMKEHLNGKHNPLEAPAIERIYGNQSTPYEVHKSGYTKESLTKVLNLHDFTITEDLSTEAEIRFKCKILPKASVLNVKNLITQSQHRKE